MCRTRTRAPAERVAGPETGALEAVARAVAHFEKRRNIIPESDIRALVLDHAQGRYRLAKIDDSIEHRVREGELREMALRGSDRSFVTDRAVKAERKILGAVKHGKGTVTALSADEAVAAGRLPAPGRSPGGRAGGRSPVDRRLSWPTA